MLRRLHEQLLLCPKDLPPSREDFEVIGVFNPGAVMVDGEVVLLVRVAERPRERRPGFIALPRWSPRDGLVIDWHADEDHVPVDARVVQHRIHCLVRLTFISHLRVVHCGDGRSVKSISNAVFAPETEEEEYGVEDPRITPIGDRFYITYVAVSRHGVATALASTADFQSFERHGIIFCPENKDVVLFPERIGRDYLALHRPSGRTLFTRPEMWLARSPDLVHWGQHYHLYGGLGPWEGGRIGAGPPPLRLSEGWLEIYHGNRPGCVPGEVGVYSAGAMLLDLESPNRVIRRSAGAVFEPVAEYERCGFVPCVVFPTGVVETGDTFLVYYGAADTCTAVVEFSRAEMLASLR